ncbi:isocitrate lyase/PEP mutase family protein [Jatrophihabitans fulvus]
MTADDVLLDPAFRVPPVAAAEHGVGWLRARVVRFSEGPDHARRRRVVEQLLAAVSPDGLDGSGHPVDVLAARLGLGRGVVADVGVVASAYHPHLPITPAADAAVERLVARCGVRDDTAAQRIGLLVQAHHAMNGLLAGRTPPVPSTRRVAPDGTVVEVALDAAPFGRGRHACPARAHAEALASRSFAARHRAAAPLLLPNAWDVASAALLVDAGFTAIGTTSLGVAAATGVPDASGRTRAATLELAAALVRLPAAITVDAEDGFGDAAAFVCDLAALGVVGVNLEDGRGTHLAAVDDQCDLLAAAKRAAPHVFVNARVDTHWLGVDRDATAARARAYVAAGADGVFVPGLQDPDAIARLAAAVPAPVNVLAHPSLSVAELGRLGVARVSTGSSLYRRALTAAVAAARALRGDVDPGVDVSYAQVQALAGSDE